MRIVIDTVAIKKKIDDYLWSLTLKVKTKLGVKNMGSYIQIQESEYKGCPRCGSERFRFARDSPNGICTGKIWECMECGQWIDVVPDYDKW